jgi:hypothetical protein
MTVEYFVTSPFPDDREALCDSPPLMKVMYFVTSPYFDFGE